MAPRKTPFRLTHGRLLEVLTYDRGTGTFTWNVQRGRQLVGSVAGSLRATGYRAIRIDGEEYLSHRLAWFYVYGEWPALQIDHKNGDRSDARIENLRTATIRQQRQNTKKKSVRRRVSEFKGVSFDKRSQRWFARIKLASGQEHLGSFDDQHSAALAYDAAAIEHFGEFARTNFPRWRTKTKREREAHRKLRPLPLNGH